MNTLTEIPNASTLIDGMLHSQKVDLFQDLLKSTEREGIENVLEFLKNTDFYTAPSSKAYHSNYNGGLLDHSLLVYCLMMKYRESIIYMKPEFAEKIPEDSVKIVGLLHDVCKTCFYKEVLKWKKNDAGQWESYPGYEIEDTFPIGHGEKSVIMLQNFGLHLNPDEMLGIRYHMGSWDGGMLSNDIKHAYLAAIDMSPLTVLVQAADHGSSLLLEKNIKY